MRDAKMAKRTEHERESEMKRKLVVLSLSIVGVLATALVTGSASADDTQCDGALPFGTYDNVIVPPGENCAIDGSEILGNLKIEPNAGVVVVQNTTIVGNLQGEQFLSLELSESTVHGNVQVKKQGNVEVCGNTIRGDLQVEEGVGGEVEIGYSGAPADEPPVEPTCAGNTILFGNLKVEKNVMTYGQIAGNYVKRGNLQVFENTGPLDISDNQVPKGNLQCSKNSPDPTGGGNTAKQKEEQCRDL
ncbi:MAG TPA: hypothetical protein VMN39_02235 [Longimicrobiaceae bacterium]|nr:hypothetical protein [Longimicrobiaceae bacterium]